MQSRSMRRYARSEGFEGRDVEAEIEKANEKLKAARKKMNDEARVVKKLNEKKFKQALEFAHRKAFIEHFLVNASVRQ